MISKIEGKKIHLVFHIGAYQIEVIDFFTLLDITSRRKAADKEIEELSNEMKRNLLHSRIYIKIYNYKRRD